MLLLILATAIAGTQAVQYTVTKQTLGSATQFIWRIFQQQNSPADRKNVQKVSFFVEDKDGVAYATNNEIHLSARYVGSYSGDLRREVSGVLYHEMTHIWQWNGNGQANGGLIEGKDLYWPIFDTRPNRTTSLVLRKDK